MLRLPLALRAAVALIFALAGLTACSGSDSGSGPASLDITVRGESITPNAERVNVGVGQTFTLNVDSDRDGKIHVHSTPEQEYEFGPGTSSFDIVIDKPGSVEIEEHQDDVVIVTLVVQ